VRIIDQATVITGSFNFTKAAQMRNAENVLIVQDKMMAQQYLDNWRARQGLSEKVSQ
jgi:phosphatidylserine/phosphatidylglycerophosphate/cardiolipin synthase-like enzyme